MYEKQSLKKKWEQPQIVLTSQNDVNNKNHPTVNEKTGTPGAAQGFPSIFSTPGHHVFVSSKNQAAS